MRSSVFVACASAVLAASMLMACMASGDDVQTGPGRPDDGTTSVLDGEAPSPDADVGADPDASAGSRRCSKAGWCMTLLPDVDLVMRDISVLPDRAVAVAESPTLGIKVLEWTDAEARWRYIDDGTQNESSLPQSLRFVGKIWMPSEDEVYYGVAPGYIYHGTRAEQDTWSWTRDLLVANGACNHQTVFCNGNPIYRARDYTTMPSLGVWGTSSDDVYAWFKNTIFHRKSVDGAAPEWVEEYTAIDPDALVDEQLFFFGAAGTSAGDIVFTGTRIRNGRGGGCGLLVRKTSNGYERAVDGTLAGSGPCTMRSGSQLIDGTDVWLTDIHALGPGDFVALSGARDVVRIKAEGEAYSIAMTSVPEILSADALNSLAAVDGELWLGGTGRVVRGSAVWDGGAFGLSTIWPEGVPIVKAIWQVQGTSNTNLWAIGVRNALHKTTP